MTDAASDPLRLLSAAYGEMSDVLADLDDAEATRPSGCAGWAVLDLAQHLVSDVRRGLVALSTPSEAPADTDAVGYWRTWRPTRDRDADGVWRTRVSASVSGGIGAVAAAYAETAAAVVVAASGRDLTTHVRTQGHVLTAADLLSTLVVETAVHHLDVAVDLDRPPPAAGPLVEVRRVLTGLLGHPLPSAWDGVTAARRGTGRAPLDDEDRAALGDLAGRFPLFG